jgi:hypothetical protein
MKFNIENLKGLPRLIKELAIGLRNLDFTNNFTSFVISDTITSSGTIVVRNKLDSTDIRYIVTSNDGDGSINKSTTWDSNYISFKNNGSVSAEVEILVFKKG